jgi:hypothetical protein
MFWASIKRDLRVRVGVRVRDSMKRSLFDHEDLRVYQTAIGFVGWQVKCTQEATEGKSYLADIVRMLVAWERSLEER